MYLCSRNCSSGSRFMTLLIGNCTKMTSHTCMVHRERTDVFPNKPKTLSGNNQFTEDERKMPEMTEEILKITKGDESMFLKYFFITTGYDWEGLSTNWGAK